MKYPSLLSIHPSQNGCLQKTLGEEGIICEKNTCQFILSFTPTGFSSSYVLTTEKIIYCKKYFLHILTFCCLLQAFFFLLRSSSQFHVKVTPDPPPATHFFLMRHIVWTPVGCYFYWRGYGWGRGSVASF